MKKLFVAFLCVLAQASAWASAVVLSPYIQVSAGDGSVRTLVAGDGSVRVVTRGDVQTWTLLDAFELSGTTISALEFTFDPDPFVDFAVAVAKFNNNGPSSFSFSFFTPYVGGPYDQVSSQLDATLQARDVAQMTGITHTTTVDALDVLTGTMPDCNSGGALTTCSSLTGPATSIAQTPASGFFVSTFGFTLDAPSTATFLGRSDLLDSNAVPTPATLPLALLALSGLGCLLHRRRAALRD